MWPDQVTRTDYRYLQIWGWGDFCFTDNNIILSCAPELQRPKNESTITQIIKRVYRRVIGYIIRL